MERLFRMMYLNEMERLAALKNDLIMIELCSQSFHPHHEPVGGRGQWKLDCARVRRGSVPRGALLLGASRRPSRRSTP